MAKVTVYDLEGKPHEMESVDAKECCAEMGWTVVAPEKEPEKSPEKTKGK